MDANHEYVWAVQSIQNDKVLALFATPDAADEHLRRLGVNDCRVEQLRVWDHSYLGPAAYRGRTIHPTELH